MHIIIRGIFFQNFASKNCSVLYIVGEVWEAKICFCFEHSCLAWGRMAPNHLAVLNKIQQRAESLIVNGLPEQQATLSTACTACSTPQMWEPQPPSIKCRTNRKPNCINSVHLHRELRCSPESSLWCPHPWPLHCHTPANIKDNSSRCMCSGGANFWPQETVQTTLVLQHAEVKNPKCLSKIHKSDMSVHSRGSTEVNTISKANDSDMSDHSRDFYLKWIIKR